MLTGEGKCVSRSLSASALKSPVNQQIGAAEPPWTLPLHTGGTLLMPNTTEVRTNADDHQAVHILCAGGDVHLGKTTVNRKQGNIPCTSFWRLRIPRFHSVLSSTR